MRKLVKWTLSGLALFCAGLFGVICYGAVQMRRTADAEFMIDFGVLDSDTAPDAPDLDVRPPL